MESTVEENPPPCRRTIYPPYNSNWITGMTHQHLPTGNAEVRASIVGQDLLFLCIGLYAHPTSTEDELAAFIANQGGDIYERHEISSTVKALNLSKKASSTKAYNPFSPRSQLKAELFWMRKPPLGVVGVEIRRLIDFDEFSMSLNTNYGHHDHSTTTGVHIEEPGNSTMKTASITVLMAIEAGDPALPSDVDGSVAHPRRWIHFSDSRRTTSSYHEVADFCDHVLTDIENNPAPGDVDTIRCLIWDNRASHPTALVAQTVEGRPTTPNRFYAVPRPPYQPKFSPIEHLICEIAVKLDQRAQPHWTTVHLRQEIIQVFSALGRGDGKFWNLFRQCGYHDPVSTF